VEKGRLRPFPSRPGVATQHERFNGKIRPVTKSTLSPEQTRETVLGRELTEFPTREIAEKRECNFPRSVLAVGPLPRQFAFYQRNLVGMCCAVSKWNTGHGRSAPAGDFSEAGDDQRGLVIFVGRHRYRLKSTSAGVDDRLPQQDLQRPYHHHRRPDRITTSTELHRYPAPGRIDTDSFEVALKKPLRQVAGRDF